MDNPFANAIITGLSYAEKTARNNSIIVAESSTHGTEDFDVAFPELIPRSPLKSLTPPAKELNRPHCSRSKPIAQHDAVENVTTTATYQGK